MKCEKCSGRGFTELEHGLIMVECDVCMGTGEINDVDNGARQPDSDIRSANASKPAKPKKSKAKKKARTRTK